MKSKTILLTVSSLIILMTTMTLLQSSGVVPLPFSVMPEEEGDHDGDHQYPDYEGSVPIAEDQESGLDGVTTVSKTEAESAALAYTTGGSVLSSELENENGYLVWKVIVNFEGTNYEIAIDAGNANVLWTSSD